MRQHLYLHKYFHVHFLSKLAHFKANSEKKLILLGNFSKETKYNSINLKKTKKIFRLN